MLGKLPGGGGGGGGGGAPGLLGGLAEGIMGLPGEGSAAVKRPDRDCPVRHRLC